MKWTGFEFYGNRDFLEIYCKHRKLTLFNYEENFGFIFNNILFGNIKLRIYLADKNISNSLNNILNFCKSQKIPILEVISSSDNINFEGNATKDYLGTYVLDLNQDSNNIWDKLKKQNRNQIRYAEKKGVIIETAKNISDFEFWWSIYEQTAKRGNFILQKYSLVRELFEKKDLSRLFLARVNDKIVAGSFLLINKWPYWWLGGSLPDYWSFKPNNLLHWRIIEWAQINKFPFYDMGGASKDSDEGPSIFKKQFGGEYKECYKYTILLNSLESSLINKLITLRYKMIKKH